MLAPFKFTNLTKALVRGAPSTSKRVADILRFYGTDAHLWLPGVGYVNGIDAANFINSDGTSAAAVDGPVGYVGDAGKTLGPELVTDGGMDASGPSTGFFQATRQIVNGEMVVTSTVASGTFQATVTNISAVAGKSYIVSVDYRSISGVPASVMVQQNSTPFSTYSTSSSNSGTNYTRYTAVFTATQNGAQVLLRCTSATAVGNQIAFDNISVREIVGAIPATQSTTASKPILRRGHVNRIRNSTMVGAVAGTPGTQPTGWAYGAPAGVSRTIVAKGTVGGLDYVDVRFFGTASAAGDALIDFEAVGSNIPALSGQTWTAAASVALIAGSWPATRTVSLTVIERNSSNTFLTSTPVDFRSLATGSELVRVTATRTLNQATTAGLTVGVRCNLSISDVVDFTVRIAAPQLETGSVANAFVPTTTAAASSPTGPMYWELDGTDDRLQLSAVPFQQADDHCVIAGVSPNADPSNYMFSLRSTSSTTPMIASIRVLNVSGNTRVQALWFDDAGTSATPTSSALFGLGSQIVATAQKTGAVRRVRANAGGWASVSTALGATTVNNPVIGASVSTTVGSHWNGTIGPVIAIKGTVSDADLLTLERWVGSLSGVTIP